MAWSRDRREFNVEQGIKTCVTDLLSPNGKRCDHYYKVWDFFNSPSLGQFCSLILCFLNYVIL